MSKVKNVEKQIWAVEGLRVRVKAPGGKQVQGTKQAIPSYPYQNAAKNGMSFSDWKSARFEAVYPGYEVAVLDSKDKVIAVDEMLLWTIRDLYAVEG